MARLRIQGVLPHIVAKKAIGGIYIYILRFGRLTDLTAKETLGLA